MNGWYFSHLQPENILLTDGMHIQLTDFGSGVIIDSSTSDSQYRYWRKNECINAWLIFSSQMPIRHQVNEEIHLSARHSLLHRKYLNVAQYMSGKHFLLISNRNVFYPCLMKLDLICGHSVVLSIKCSPASICFMDREWQ
jgi:serine/threonine protein kinase